MEHLLTAQDSSSFSLSMQGRAELEQAETPELCSGDLFASIFFSSLTEAFVSDFSFSLSVQ
jgi:hypothetical protein